MTRDGSPKVGAVPFVALLLVVEPAVAVAIHLSSRLSVHPPGRHPVFGYAFATLLMISGACLWMLNRRRSSRNDEPPPGTP